MLVDTQTLRGTKMSTTTKAKTLPTSRAKSPKLPKTTRRLAEKAKAKVTPKAITSDMLKKTLAASVEQVPATPKLDGADQVPAASICELVTPVQISARGRAPKAKPAKVAKVEPVAKAKRKVEKRGTPKVDHTDTLLGLLSQPDRCTPREMMTATGLSHGALKTTVAKLLRKKNLKVVLQRNPQPNPKDRTLTSYLYGVEPRA
jgi:hypothetical protein